MKGELLFSFFGHPLRAGLGNEQVRTNDVFVICRLSDDKSVDGQEDNDLFWRQATTGTLPVGDRLSSVFRLDRFVEGKCDNKRAKLHNKSSIAWKSISFSFFLGV